MYLYHIQGCMETTHNSMIVRYVHYTRTLRTLQHNDTIPRVHDLTIPWKPLFKVYSFSAMRIASSVEFL